jgi:hypothetical protein
VCQRPIEKEKEKRRRMEVGQIPGGVVKEKKGVWKRGAMEEESEE